VTMKKTKYSNSLFIIILCLAILCRCGSDKQGPETAWGQIIGGTGYDTGQAVAQTSDGGYIVIGYTDSFIADAPRIYIIRLDSDGDTLWTDTYGSSDVQGFGISAATDGNFIIAGFSQAAGGGDVLCVKINDDGGVLWQNTYGGSASDIAFAVDATPDGGAIVTGWTVIDSLSGKDVYVIRIDGAGDTLWTRVYGGPGDDFGTAVCQVNDGGFLVTGWTDSYGAGSDDVYLLHLDVSGDTLWTRVYGDKNQDYGEGVIQAAHGNFILTGVTQDANEAMSRIFLLEVDTNGDTVWLQTYDEGLGFEVAQASDGGYILAGSHFNNFPNRNAYLLRTDANGIMIWEKSYGDAADDSWFDVMQTPDGGFLAVGETESFGAGSRDVYMIKTVAESE
jgi:hypothetical protein